MTTIYPSRAVSIDITPSTQRLVEGVLTGRQTQVSVEDQVDEVDEWNRRARTVVFAP